MHGPPLHRSCALYAAAGSCPFLRYRTSQGRSTDGIRGSAAVVGFPDYGIVHDNTFDIPLSFAYWKVVEEIPFKKSADVADLYAQSITADAELNFTNEPRWYWTDSPRDVQCLQATWSNDVAQVAAGLRQSTTTVSGHTVLTL